jgi:dihydroxyacetone kinase
MLVFSGAMLSKLAENNIEVTAVYMGTFMTALDMHGISVSLLQLADQLLEPLLHSPTTAPAWKPSSYRADVYTSNLGGLILGDTNQFERPRSVNNISNHEYSANEERASKIYFLVIDSNAYLRDVLLSICDELILNENYLTELDMKCGDGDCGHTVMNGAVAVRNELRSHLDNSHEAQSQGIAEVKESGDTTSALSAVCSHLADIVSKSMGGTLGAVIELMLRSMSNYYKEELKSSDISSSSIGALESGMSAISMYGGARLGMRTMLDALDPALRSLRSGMCTV